MTAQTERISPLGRGWRWLNRFGLAVPLIIGAVLAIMVAITAISPRYHAPNVVNAGSTDDYEIGAPHFFDEQNFWLVHLPGGEFVALYDRDPGSGCSLSFGSRLEHMGRTGWFRDACSGSIYDIAGTCFGGPCDLNLNRLSVTLVDSDVMVDPRTPPDEPAATTGDPVNPPQ